jgi:hypothetical protein
MQFHNGSDKGTNNKCCANLRKNVIKTLPMIRQAFREESMTVYEKYKLTETDKGETGEEQSQERAYPFL